MTEKYIPKKKSIMLYGYDSAGKSRELNKIYKRRLELFRASSTFLYISFHDSIAEIIYKNITDTHIKNYILSLPEDKQIFAESNISKQFFKIEVLKFIATGAYVFIDDLDKFTGKKLEIVKDLVRVSKVVYATARDYKSINKTIYKQINYKDHTAITLSTKNSFDATNYILIALMVPFAIAGQYAIVMMLLLMNRYMDKGLGR